MGSLPSFFKLSLRLTTLVTGMGLGTSGCIRPGGKATGPLFGAGIRFGRERVQGGLGAIRWGVMGSGASINSDLGSGQGSTDEATGLGTSRGGKGSCRHGRNDRSDQQGHSGEVSAQGWGS